MIRNKRWVMGNKVLLGDAKATAHFSIGSGTKLAMEDAIALYEAFRREPSVGGACALRDRTGARRSRRRSTRPTSSLVWFEHVARFWDFDPVQFAFGVMTRAKAITYDNLRLRAPDFVDAVDRPLHRQVRTQGFDVSTRRARPSPMFQPFRLREMIVPNRVVVSPMDMYSAKDGVPGDFHLVHYGSRAMGGAGPPLHRDDLRLAGGAHHASAARACGTTSRRPPGSGIVDFVHANSAAKFCLQLGHSGRKGATKLDVGGHGPPAG